MKKIGISCPLCSSDSHPFVDDSTRSYLLCSVCSLVFVPRELLISKAEELERYLEHNNDENDERYRAYLTKTMNEILPRIGKGKKGLDFGCGESLLMEKIFRENGVEVESFDLYFRPIETIWQKKFDFILLSEVIEHLREPKTEMERLRSILAPGGFIFIKTMFRPDAPEDFRDWFYKRDPTHIQFFSPMCIRVLADRLGMKGPMSTALPDLTYIMD